MIVVMEGTIGLMAIARIEITGRPISTPVSLYLSTSSVTSAISRGARKTWDPEGYNRAAAMTGLYKREY